MTAFHRWMAATGLHLGRRAWVPRAYTAIAAWCALVAWANRTGPSVLLAAAAALLCGYAWAGRRRFLRGERPGP